MSVEARTSYAGLTPEEVERRLAEYRSLGFQRKAPAQVVYQEPYLLCPWPKCTQRIDAIHFQLDRWAKQDELDRYLQSWWRGPGLVGNCPGCGQPVLFALTSKSKVTDVSSLANAVLPDDWYAKASLVCKSSD
jgi:hypothetical protein